MVRWKLRNRPKSTEDTTSQIDIAQTEKKPEQPVTSEPEEEPVMEFDEVLHSRTTPLPPVSNATEPRKEPLRRPSWENPDVVEHNVDIIGRKKTERRGVHAHATDELEKKVDRIIAKKKWRR